MGAMRAFLGAAVVGLLIGVCPWSTASAQTEAPSGVGGLGDPANIPREDTLETTYGLAMGSGARAGAIGTSALAYNTSNMAAVSTYHVEAFSQIIPGSKSNGGTYWTIGSSVSDSTTATPRSSTSTTASPTTRRSTPSAIPIVFAPTGVRPPPLATAQSPRCCR